MTPGKLEICRRFEDSLPELLDLEGEGEAGNLSPGERDALLWHAATCARCAEAFRAYRRTVEILRDLPPHEAPHDFLGWVREATGARPPAAAAPGKAPAGAFTWRKAQVLWISLAALLVVAVTAAFFLPSPREEKPLPLADETALARMEPDRADSPRDPANSAPASVPSRPPLKPLPSPPGSHPVSFTLEVSPDASPIALLTFETDLRTEFERLPREDLRLETSAEPLETRARRAAAPAAAQSAARGARAPSAPEPPAAASREVSRSAPPPRSPGQWILQVPADRVEALQERLSSWSQEQGAQVVTLASRGASNDAAAEASPPLPLKSTDFQARPGGESPLVEVRIFVRSR